MMPPDDRTARRHTDADAPGADETTAPVLGTDGTTGDRYARLPAPGASRPAARSTSAKGFAERINRLRGDSPRIVPEARVAPPGLALRADD